MENEGKIRPRTTEPEQTEAQPSTMHVCGEVRMCGGDPHLRGVLLAAGDALDRVAQGTHDELPLAVRLAPAARVHLDLGTDGAPGFRTRTPVNAL